MGVGTVAPLAVAKSELIVSFSFCTTLQHGELMFYR